MDNAEVAPKLNVTGATVGKWRVGAPRKITDGQIEALVTKILESMPAQGTQWSTRLMAQEMGMTQNAIVRIWHAFGLQPHRVENFTFSNSAARAGGTGPAVA